MHTSSCYILCLIYAGFTYKVKAILNTSTVHVCVQLCIIHRRAGYLRHGDSNSSLMSNFQNLSLYCSLQKVKCVRVLVCYFLKQACGYLKLPSFSVN